MESVAVPLARLPRYVVLEPVSTVRFEVQLARRRSEIDVELDAPRPGRSFVLLIGPVGGPVIQRVRLNGRARIVFQPKDHRAHLLMLANPQKEPLVLRLRGRVVRASVRSSRRPSPTRWSDLAVGSSTPTSRRRRPSSPLAIVGVAGAGAKPGPVDAPVRRPRPKG